MKALPKGAFELTLESGRIITSSRSYGAVVREILPGARASIMNRATAEALGVQLPELPAAEDIRGATGHSMPAIALQVGHIEVGSREWRDVQVAVADLHVFDVLERAGQPTMILGSDLLFEGRLVVDYENASVLIELP